MNIPSDPEAEESVVAASLVDQEAARTCCELLEGSDFWDERYGWAFDCIREVVTAGARPSVSVIAHMLSQKEQMDTLAGRELLDGAVRRLATPIGVDWWANIVRERAIARRCVQLATNFATDCAAADADLEQLIASHEAKLAAVRAGSRFDSGSTDAAEVAEQVAERLDRFISNPLAIRGQKTGWHKFDMTVDGLTPQRLMLIGAATSVGKSLICHNLIRQVSGGENRIPTLLFSTEMSPAAVQWRMTWMEAGIDPQSVKRAGAMSKDDKERIWTAYATVGSWPVRYPKGGSPTPGRIAAEIRRDKAKRGTWLAFVDHIGHVVAGGRDTKERTTNAAKGLKQITMDEDVMVIASAHVNREGVKGGGWLEMSNLADSSDLEKEADDVLMVTPCFRNGDYQFEPLADAAARQIMAEEGAGFVMFGVEKNRNGVRDHIPMKLDWWTGGGRFTVTR